MPSPVGPGAQDPHSECIESKINALGNLKHVLVYDSCTTHHTVRSQKPRTSYNRSSRMTFNPRNTGADFDDLPPLDLLEDDDEDEARTFSRFQKDSNTWLLFSGAIAFTTSVFITSFTGTTAQQRAATEVNRILATQLQNQMHAMANEGGAEGVAFNITLASSQPPERDMQDVLVPALCYSSLVLSLIGAMVTLQVKHWLMTCTMSVFPLSPRTQNPDLPTMRAAAIKIREYRKTRKATVIKTERIQWVVPPLMYGALVFLICGVLVKAGTVTYSLLH